MTTTHSPGPPSGPPQPPPYNWKATFWLVVGMLVVIGAMGVFMRVIPTPFTQRAPTTVPTPGLTSQPAVTPQLAATRAPAATPAPTPLVIAIGAGAPTAAPQAQQATVGPTAQPTVAPTRAPVVESTAAAVTPTNAQTQPAGAQATPGPTIDPALAAEILPAYQHYWEVRDDAVATLDGSHLSEVTDGPELVAGQTYLDQLRSQNKASVGPAEHAITLVSATPEDAVIYDRVIDKSIFVDGTTREPLPPEEQGASAAEVVGYYYLHKVDGVWKVVGEGKP